MVNDAWLDPVGMVLTAGDVLIAGDVVWCNILCGVVWVYIDCHGNFHPHVGVQTLVICCITHHFSTHIFHTFYTQYTQIA